MEPQEITVPSPETQIVESPPALPPSTPALPPSTPSAEMHVIVSHQTIEAEVVALEATVITREDADLDLDYHPSSKAEHIVYDSRSALGQHIAFIKAGAEKNTPSVRQWVLFTALAFLFWALVEWPTEKAFLLGPEQHYALGFYPGFTLTNLIGTVVHALSSGVSTLSLPLSTLGFWFLVHPVTVHLLRMLGKSMDKAMVEKNMLAGEAFRKTAVYYGFVKFYRLVNLVLMAASVQVLVAMGEGATPEELATVVLIMTGFMFISMAGASSATNSAFLKEKGESRALGLLSAVFWPLKSLLWFGVITYYLVRSVLSVIFCCCIAVEEVSNEGGIGIFRLAIFVVTLGLALMIAVLGSLCMFAFITTALAGGVVGYAFGFTKHVDRWGPVCIALLYLLLASESVLRESAVLVSSQTLLTLFMAVLLLVHIGTAIKETIKAAGTSRAAVLSLRFARGQIKAERTSGRIRSNMRDEQEDEQASSELTALFVRHHTLVGVADRAPARYHTLADRPKVPYAIALALLPMPIAGPVLSCLYHMLADPPLHHTTAAWRYWDSWVARALLVLVGLGSRALEADLWPVELVLCLWASVYTGFNWSLIWNASRAGQRWGVVDDELRHCSRTEQGMVHVLEGGAPLPTLPGEVSDSVSISV